ncbi:hypothetical protein P3W45_000004 [Vairimorpha bombi]|jgi:hypothetical protein
MNITHDLSKPVSPKNIKFKAKTIKKGRFIIEDYSECVVKDYKKFVIKLKSCDRKMTSMRTEDLIRISKLIEIQQKQISLMKSCIGNNPLLNSLFENSSETVDRLLKEIKDKLEN